MRKKLRQLAIMAVLTALAGTLTTVLTASPAAAAGCYEGAVSFPTQNLTVVRADVDQGLLLIKGAVPGADGGWVLVRDAAKRKQPDGVPYPGAVKAAPKGE